MQQLTEIGRAPLLVLAFGVVVLTIWYLIHRATRDIRLERLLPTSKVGSMTVGTIEVRGRTSALNTCRTPWTKTECIAYCYEKQRVEMEDGRIKTFVIDSETDVMPFELVDETGRVLVETDGLKMIGVPVTSSNEGGTDFMHKEIILKNDFDVLMIGRASPRDGKMVICKDEERNVFTLTNYVADVLVDRRQAPMNRLLGIYSLITLVLLAFIIAA